MWVCVETITRNQNIHMHHNTAHCCVLKGHVAVRLNQEFVRIKSSGKNNWFEAEEVRAATLASLVTRTFTKRCIVFFDTKVREALCAVVCVGNKFKGRFYYYYNIDIIHVVVAAAAATIVVVGDATVVVAVVFF